MSDKPKIHTHASGEEGLAVNAYLVETDNGAVAIDATLTVSEARALWGELEALRKPIIAVLLYIPNVDI